MLLFPSNAPALLPWFCQRAGPAHPLIRDPCPIHQLLPGKAAPELLVLFLQLRRWKGMKSPWQHKMMRCQVVMTIKKLPGLLLHCPQRRRRAAEEAGKEATGGRARECACFLSSSGRSQDVVVAICKYLGLGLGLPQPQSTPPPHPEPVVLLMRLGKLCMWKACTHKAAL